MNSAFSLSKAEPTWCGWADMRFIHWSRLFGSSCASNRASSSRCCRALSGSKPISPWSPAWGAATNANGRDDAERGKKNLASQSHGCQSPRLRQIRGTRRPSLHAACSDSRVQNQAREESFRVGRVVLSPVAFRSRSSLRCGLLVRLSAQAQRSSRSPRLPEAPVPPRISVALSLSKGRPSLSKGRLEAGVGVELKSSGVGLDARRSPRRWGSRRTECARTTGPTTSP